VTEIHNNQILDSTRIKEAKGLLDSSSVKDILQQRGVGGNIGTRVNELARGQPVDYRRIERGPDDNPTVQEDFGQGGFDRIDKDGFQATFRAHGPDDDLKGKSATLRVTDEDGRHIRRQTVVPGTDFSQNEELRTKANGEFLRTESTFLNGQEIARQRQERRLVNPNDPTQFDNRLRDAVNEDPTLQNGLKKI
jgi:hypothetical protein